MLCRLLFTLQNPPQMSFPSGSPPETRNMQGVARVEPEAEPESRGAGLRVRRGGRARIRTAERGDMATATGRARQLQAALRAEEPRAVEELLRLGADPSLVLEEGAAAVHLAARAYSPRALRCLRILLRRGADPNARSAEALTPVHVAAAWGCRGALELLLSGGGDPTLRDQDGLRPLDWALQQRHHNCARVLRELDGPPGAREPAAPADLEHAMCRGRVFAGSPGLTTPPHVSLASEQHMSPAKLAAAGEVPVKPLELCSSEATRSPDCSSDTSFVTALEDSPQPQHPAGTPGSAADPWLSRGAKAAGDGALSCQLQALTLTREATNVPSQPGDRDPGALHPQGPVSPMSDLQLLQALRALGHSPGPVTPFTRGYYLRRLQEAQASLGHSPELAEALKTGHVPDCQADEAALAQHFQRLDPAKRWREGVTKSSFTYLLLDPRQTQGLPARASSLTLAECLQSFVRAIFYVGKGTRARPDAHLWEALGYRLSQDTADLSHLGQRPWCYLPTLLPARRSRGGIHSGGLSVGCPRDPDTDQPETGALLWRGGLLATHTAPTFGSVPATSGLASLSG
ncbi:ankyrin repeat and LEM domain-containing protein 1 isoform X7 [Cricetulus griseus]|uniref:Ankyrin repeat and LEM domain-containing protein 1 isoform X7 n=2 Tax=Cricetulus griseus TaxID=10029 RepID=A0A9J7F896_CRIGR|nr:ankyrin repeat and LEM domain-containing protein 1 isoform X7 [Cricetulus griseus]